MSGTRTQQTVYRRRLNAERRRAAAALARHEADWAALTTGDGATAGEDDSLRIEELEGIQRLIEHERGALAAVEHALERLGAGTYGDCALCGQPIAAERLAAFPTASHCLPCQRALDAGQRPARIRRLHGVAT